MKLYYSKGACSLAVHITLRELNLPCEYIPVTLSTHTLPNGDDFYKVTPKGAVPALQLDNGTVLTENAVIQQFIADSHKATHLLPPVGDMKRYEILAWLNYASTDLHKNFSPFFNPKVPKEIREEAFKPVLAKKLEFLNTYFATHDYITGKQYTLPDAYVFTTLRWVGHAGLSLNDYPHVLRYFNQMKARPSVVAAMQEEGLS